MSAHTLILGLGSPILSDDGIGIVMARRLKGRIPGVEAATAAMISLDLLEQIAGYRRLFVIDALARPGATPGTLHRLAPESGTLHLFCSHGINFDEILQLGRQLGTPMPEVSIYGIEIADEIPFGEQLSELMVEQLEGNLAEIERDIREGIEP
ncbi:hydrogenase maturation protease [Trichloromonas sp.]|uniref:hydrogenase maturation protease n=1 Tax=Trichloromonas sp. TaxID=3069249 RepID=UPI003D81732B